MIYTVTFNPSLDYITTVEDFKLGQTNRAASEIILPGGKGINVSIVLTNLGYENTALGFTAGFSGDEIIRRLNEMGICNEFISLEQGFSRINLKITNIEGTELNGQGPEIPEEKLLCLLDRIQELKEGDVLFLSGSIPKSLPNDIYGKMMDLVKDKGILVAADAAGELLTEVLSCRPFLIKPNHQELGELFGVELKTRQEVIPYGRRLQEQGAQNVLVSLASEGAVLFAGDGEIYEAQAPKGTLVNAVGAGDSMLAGFMAGFLETGDYAHALRMGTAAGSASAFSEHLATREETDALFHKLSVKRLPLRSL